MESILVKNQVKTLIAENVTVQGVKYKKVVCNIRYDDRCGNGHNSFGITGEFYRNNGQIRRNDPEMCGCCHDELVVVFPEVEHMIKWHFMNSDGPLHYLADTMYHAKEVKKENHFVYLSDHLLSGKKLLGLFKDDELQAILDRFEGFNLEVKSEPTYDSKEADIEAAQRSAVWPDATLEQLQDKDQLLARLPSLIAEFKADIEEFGLFF